MNLARQRENNLTECLNRRHALAEEVLQENLEISQRRIANKESELTALRKDLEAERLRCIEMTAQHNELVESLQSKLKVAQERCAELSSSALCLEVGELRERIKELLTSKKITDDINEILQEELRDVREQIELYEQSLGVFSAIEEPESSPRHLLPLFHDAKGGQISTILTKATPSRNRRRSFQSVTFADEVKEDVPKLRRPSSAGAFPLTSTRDQDAACAPPTSTPFRLFVLLIEILVVMYFSNSFDNSLNNRAVIPTSDEKEDPSLSPKIDESISTLKSELKNTLAKYKGKREQITSLYEKLFAARCDLHKAVAERDRAESARTDLQVRSTCYERSSSLENSLLVLLRLVRRH